MLSLKIEPDKMYTRLEVANMLQRSFYTIKNWSEIGLKSKRNGIQTLAIYRIGREPYIIGKNLILFLNNTQ
jgi:hypothetical protein